MKGEPSDRDGHDDRESGAHVRPHSHDCDPFLSSMSPIASILVYLSRSRPSLFHLSASSYTHHVFPSPHSHDCDPFLS